MTDAIKKGMYSRSNEAVAPPVINKNPRVKRVMLEGGSYTDVVNPEYVSLLEVQILELKKLVGIQDRKLAQMEIALNRHQNAIKSLDSDMVRKIDKK